MRFYCFIKFSCWNFYRHQFSITCEHSVCLLKVAFSEFMVHENGPRREDPTRCVIAIPIKPNGFNLKLLVKAILKKIYFVFVFFYDRGIVSRIEMIHTSSPSPKPKLPISRRKIQQISEFHFPWHIVLSIPFCQFYDFRIIPMPESCRGTRSRLRW